ncbi:hypothetical protein [Actinotalea subterranea]|uniref:hypothetical protein n=1 Tax=Actinotalea subterranea TaxID=2607497 RepID=UPI0011EDDE56|nr:hypothetical protein [Actinotalea subterranea]
MTQALLTRPRPTSPTAPAWTLTLQGPDPVSGFRATWQITPLVSDDLVDHCTVERVDGEITHPAVWMQATKVTTVMTRDEAFRLAQQVSGR